MCSDPLATYLPVRFLRFKVMGCLVAQATVTLRQHQDPRCCLWSPQTQRSESWLCLPRSLDLTGPLLLGGVPNLPEDFPVHNRQFVGCMRNLSVDGKNVDMASFIANNGTRAGMA